MNLIEKLYTLIIFLAVIIGISIGQAELIRANAESIIVPLLVAMLYITFLQIPIRDIKIAFKNIKFTYTSIMINFVWTPILAWLLAMVFLGDNPSLYIGFIMLMVTPCTDRYLIFTGIAKGNVALSTAILPLNLILQVILLPIYLLIFGGTTGVIELGFLVESLLVTLIIPLVLAVFTKILLKNKDQLRKSLVSNLSVLPIIFLILAIAAMFASQGQLLLNHLELLWKITIPESFCQSKSWTAYEISELRQSQFKLDYFSQKFPDCFSHCNDCISRPAFDCIDLSSRPSAGIAYPGRHHPDFIIYY
mgnify:CR=1 FL=1